jgi:glycosyltransferase involved in cell wall biosynthesis
MRILLVTPHYEQSRGNTVTVNRMAEGLRKTCHTIDIVSSTDAQLAPIGLEWDLVHGFNANYFYTYWKKQGSPELPYFITLTGTDLNHSLFDDNAKEQVLQCLREAQMVHVFNEKAKELLWQQAPWVSDKTVLIPQGIYVLPERALALDKEEGRFVFLLPAGIRKVKQVPAAIRMLLALHELDPKIRLWIVGPILEQEEGNRVEELVRQHSSWVRYVGQVEHEDMGALYRQSDVVLNTSLSEGQSAAILEAMSLGIPVLASDIPGNRDLVTHGTTGYLYEDEQEFLTYAERLMSDQELRIQLGQAGIQYVQEHHSVERELQSLVAAYCQVIERSRL